MESESSARVNRQLSATYWEKRGGILGKNGGQRWNRTTDTRIFKMNDQFTIVLKSVACGVCPNEMCQ